MRRTGSSELSRILLLDPTPHVVRLSREQAAVEQQAEGPDLLLQPLSIPQGQPPLEVMDQLVVQAIERHCPGIGLEGPIAVAIGPGLDAAARPR